MIMLKASCLVFCFIILKPISAVIANAGHYVHITTDIHTNRIIAQLEEIVGKGLGSVT
jgi:hypothetical protein